MSAPKDRTTIRLPRFDRGLKGARAELLADPRFAIQASSRGARVRAVVMALRVEDGLVLCTVGHVFALASAVGFEPGDAAEAAD